MIEILGVLEIDTLGVILGLNVGVIETLGVLDIDGNIVATYTARNKKVAEQEASRLALEVLEKREAEEA